MKVRPFSATTVLVIGPEVLMLKMFELPLPLMVMPPGSEEASMFALSPRKVMGDAVVMVWPESAGAKWMMMGLVVLATAARKEPAPWSLVVVTITVGLNRSWLAESAPSVTRGS